MNATITPLMERIRGHIEAHQRHQPSPYSDSAVASGRVPPPHPPTLVLADVDAIFAPLPAVPYLVQSLDICPGAPTLIAGYGFSGKTIAAQSMALTVACGGPVWGSIALARQGRVVHVDYEQGMRLTAERYQRLAAARGLTAADLRGRLAVAALPTLHLSSMAALDAYCRAADGAALLIVDSLRASAPDVDENSSDVRRLLDLLTRVSEKTGAVTLPISHARKQNDKSAGAAKEAIRGSSAIFDACASVLMFAAMKGEPVLVQHEKARTSGILADDFELTIEDVEVGGNPRGGLRVLASGSAPKDERMAAKERAASERLEQAVIQFVVRHPRCSQNDVISSKDFAGRDSLRRKALGRLVLDGPLVCEDGPNRAKLYSVGSTQ